MEDFVSQIKAYNLNSRKLAPPGNKLMHIDAK